MQLAACEAARHDRSPPACRRAHVSRTPPPAADTGSRPACSLQLTKWDHKIHK